MIFYRYNSKLLAKNKKCKHLTIIVMLIRDKHMGVRRHKLMIIKSILFYYKNITKVSIDRPTIRAFSSTIKLSEDQFRYIKG